MEYLIVGSYTTKLPHVKNPKGEGISLLSLDKKSGDLNLICRYRDIDDPSYQWLDDSGSFLSIGKDSDGCATLNNFSLEGDIITLQSSVVLDSVACCHIYHSREFNLSYLSSYNAGRVILSNGFTLDFSGSGPNSVRQEAPHIHQAVPYNEFIYCPDLGSDRVWVLSNTEGRVEVVSSLVVPPGYGPRHMVISGDYAYILCELVPKLLTAKIDNTTGELEIISEISTVSDPKRTISNPAAIKLHPSGETLVVSNRFDDTVSVISTVKDKEMPELLAEFSSMGETPREISFNRTGEWLLIANQDSNDIQLRAFDTKSGRPNVNWGKTFNIGSPVCITSVPPSV